MQISRDDEALREAVVTKPDITTLKADIDTRLAQLETRLTTRFGTMIAAGVAILIAVKFFG